MTDRIFKRFAVYYAPPTEAWARWATGWLGWDMRAGTTVPHPTCDLDVEAITATPRKYGLHATMKPPFRLADGQSRADLEAEMDAMCAALAPVTLDGLSVARLGRFLALRPVGDETALSALAAACVRELDAFRAPASATEMAKRRGNGLPPSQEANLQRWGYPYVMEDFNFHITLTGRLPADQLGSVQSVLEANLSPHLPRPFVISDLALVGEAGDGRFHLIHRYPLRG